MLSLHAYGWSGPGAWSPKAFTAGVVHGLLSFRDWASGLSLYGEMLGSHGDAAVTLEQQFDKEWGWCLDDDVVPVRHARLLAMAARAGLGGCS